MANWLSTKSVAEKYGIPKEQIREWIRLRYLTCSSIGTERLEKINDDLLEINYHHTQREAELEENFEKMMNYTNEILALHKKIMKDYENMMLEKGGVWHFLCHLFITKKNKSLI